MHQKQTKSKSLNNYPVLMHHMALFVMQKPRSKIDCSGHFEEYESYTTHPGVGVGVGVVVGVHVTLWLRFCMQVLKYYMYCIELFYNPIKLSHLC